MAESNRLPFDLPEAEQELVGGYHTEYNALKFAMFFLAEYTHVITISFLTAILFFGGWHFPWIAEPTTRISVRLWSRCLFFWPRSASVILFIMLIRWTLPRFRFDQLMTLSWKVFIPLCLSNLLGMMIVKQYDLSRWWMLPFSVLLVILAAGTSLFLAGIRARRGRVTCPEPRPRAPRVVKVSLPEPHDLQKTQRSAITRGCDRAD